MITFDIDVDASKRVLQPEFYGLIPDDHRTRTTYFVLMTLINTLHNLSRSIGCALLIASSGGENIAFYILAREMALFFTYKVSLQASVAVKSSSSQSKRPKIDTI